jgi:hypothetical protein
MTSAIFSNNELRVWNRKRRGNRILVGFPEDEKAELRKLGFRWDPENKSYYLKNPTSEAGDYVESGCEVQRFEEFQGREGRGV